MWRKDIDTIKRCSLNRLTATVGIRSKGELSEVAQDNLDVYKDSIAKIPYHEYVDTHICVFLQHQKVEISY